MSSNVGRSFESFIFLDMETTGFTRPIGITELSFVAIEKRHLLAADASSFEHAETALPRIYDKLHLCVRPLQQIEEDASNLTGISQEDLSQKKPFDEQLADMIRAFCLRQPQPACLVAHSGDDYDFEILAWHFTEVGSDFLSSISASDSLKAFKYLHVESTHDNSWVSFALSNLYEREMGRKVEGRYTVGGDSMALIELVLKKPEVLEYIERGAHPMGTGGNQPEEVA